MPTSRRHDAHDLPEVAIYAAPGRLTGEDALVRYLGRAGYTVRLLRERAEVEALLAEPPANGCLFLADILTASRTGGDPLEAYKVFLHAYRECCQRGKTWLFAVSPPRGSDGPPTVQATSPMLTFRTPSTPASFAA